MGLKKKVKKAKNKATGAVKKSASVVSNTTQAAVKTVATVQKQAQKVANTPIVKTAVTAVATTIAGPAGAAAVQSGYSVLNSGNPLDAVLGTVLTGYLVNKGLYNQITGKSSSPLDALMSDSVSYAGNAEALLQTANRINNTVKTAKKDKENQKAGINSRDIVMVWVLIYDKNNKNTFAFVYERLGC